jgi:hypothetical protein
VAVRAETAYRWLTSAHIGIVVARLLQELPQREPALVHGHASPLRRHALLRQHDRSGLDLRVGGILRRRQLPPHLVLVLLEVDAAALLRLRLGLLRRGGGRRGAALRPPHGTGASLSLSPSGQRLLTRRRRQAARSSPGREAAPGVGLVCFFSTSTVGRLQCKKASAAIAPPV